MNDLSRYQKQYLLKEIGEEGQRRLSRASVAVAGLGALGSVSAGLLARAGVGRLTLIDRDFLEISNLQRQVLFDERDVEQNLPKAVAAKQKLEAVNSEIEIRAEAEDLNPGTAEALLAQADLILDGTDNFETRFLINDYSLAHRVPWIYGGAVGTEGMTYVILPDEGPCLRCLLEEIPALGQGVTCDQAGILAAAAHTIASFQVTEALKILSGRKDAVERRLCKLDLWKREIQHLDVRGLPEAACSGCRQKDFPYLQGRGTQAVSLCGRNAFQIHPERPVQMDFRKLASVLQAAGKVRFNEYLLTLHAAPYDITVFPAGRAIIRGVRDAGQAKSLYVRYIGG